jgi:hypothetical protein
MTVLLPRGISHLLLVDRQREQGGTDLAVLRFGVGNGSEAERLRRLRSPSAALGDLAHDGLLRATSDRFATSAAAPSR